MSEGVLVQYLKDQIKVHKRALTSIEKKRKSIDEEIDHLEPHEDEDYDECEEGEDEDEVTKRSPPKKKKPKKVIEGPCAGLLWEDEAPCPGAEAKRGRFPERDANTFNNTRLVIDGVKSTRVLCTSCKKDYTKYKKSQ